MHVDNCEQKLHRRVLLAASVLFCFVLSRYFPKSRDKRKKKLSHFVKCKFCAICVCANLILFLLLRLSFLSFVCTTACAIKLYSHNLRYDSLFNISDIYFITHTLWQTREKNRPAEKRIHWRGFIASLERAMPLFLVCCLKRSQIPT